MTHPTDAEADSLRPADRAPDPLLPRAVPSIGARIKQVRRSRGDRLGDVAARTGLSTSTLSKIENDKVSPTFAHLMRLAEGLGIPLSDLVDVGFEAAAPSARMAVSRAGEGEVIRTPSFEIVPLCPGLKMKRMNPLFEKITVFDKDAGDRMIRHGGEEFVYVLDGAIEVHTEFYEPVRLDKGDSIYLDSRMAHTFVSVGRKAAQILNVWLAPQPQSQSNLVAFATSVLSPPK